MGPAAAAAAAARAPPAGCEEDVALAGRMRGMSSASLFGPLAAKTPKKATPSRQRDATTPPGVTAELGALKEHLLLPFNSLRQGPASKPLTVEQNLRKLKEFIKWVIQNKFKGAASMRAIVNLGPERWIDDFWMSFCDVELRARRRIK